MIRCWVCGLLLIVAVSASENCPQSFQIRLRKSVHLPTNFARVGRIKAEKITIFYGATDKDTCLAELRPAIGQESAIIALQTTKILRMLDFTRMRTAYKSLSDFQSDFSEQAVMGNPEVITPGFSVGPKSPYRDPSGPL